MEEGKFMRKIIQTIFTVVALFFAMSSTAYADCETGYYAIEENSCCTNGTYNGCCGSYGWTQPSSCSGGDPNFQPSYAYCGSGGCYVWCPAVCQPDPAYNDCNGDHMGDAVYDECGVCDGDGSTCLDDCGIPNGDNSTCADDCGVPNGDNSTCADCAGTPNGNAEEDVCGVCNGFGINANGWQVATDGSTSQNPLYCQWSSYTENVDWAYGTSGTFEECAAECEATSGCTGFEHGGGYCAFWFNNACVNDDWQNSLGIEYNNDTATGWENSGILTYWYTGQCDCDDSIIDACGECGGDNVSCGIIVGDINFDGSINVIDVVILVDVILDNAQNNLSDEEFFAADFNADGVLNVIDVVPLVNSILNQE